MANAFQLEERDRQIALVTFDLPGKKVNTLGHAVLSELAELVGRLEGRTDLRGLLFRGKPGQFIAGADLNELGALAFATKEQVTQGLMLGHTLFDKISRLPFPTVALIDGPCMGGGTELVLAMDERIASTNPQTKIALPEVKVGLLPAWGGTQRLPRLIGVHPAVEMITSGEGLSPAKAATLGLVFDAVPAERLVEEGCRLVEILQESGDWKKNRKTRSGPIGLTDDQANFLFAAAEGFIKGKTKGQYPAPLAALKAIRQGCNLPLEEGLKAEQAAAMEVVGSPISANLIGVFFMGNRLARDPGVADPSVVPRPVRRVGVLGAGLMGAGIAAAHARSGIPATMVDVDDARLADGMKRAAEVVAGRIKIGRATPEDMARMLALLSTSTSHQVFADCDVVVEAVTENEKVKTAMYRELAKVLRPDAILASNTSTISITRMAESAPDPARFVGMHFFHPVDRMELVEVIRGEQTSDETVATIVALAKAIRKTPIVVRDCAGFLVNRVLFPYMNEALLLLAEGGPMDAIDRAATSFGMPMGPIALEDLVGLDTAWYAGQVMLHAYPDRAVPTPILGDLVKAGRLGKKSGAGFRRFVGKQGRPEADPAISPFLEKHKTGDRTPDDAEITDRLFLAMLLEATRALEEGIVREPADADMGLILGIGFPPFRGGILRWCDTEGAAAIVDRLAKYASLGKRFEPTETLKRHARTGETFYPAPKLAAGFGGRGESR
ncbi:MAG: 3-hydroxyacyl-CoA dehydrogenase / enoyl-CoA hydratase / 3-hydroxybutyryl-CoA epimerase / enoyl-CoA [Chloroflexota bacterium]|nr:3-hydroxyacyl-CoA dehydrogenase / enoyl-CoA hydratase / 3-hydroxybutyryl-CoA epimerase / enoyl-CoA [Chloroflexota bacterium]